MIVKVDKERCIACGFCFSCPGVFEFDSDGLVRPIGKGEVEATRRDALNDVAYECPTGAITIDEREEKA